MTPTQFQRRVIVPFAAFTMLLVAVAIYSAYSHKQQSINDKVLAENNSVHQFYSLLLKNDTDQLKGFLEILMSNENLIDTWLEGDSGGTLRLSHSVFRQLRANCNVTHFYFIKPDGTVFLRVHAPERHSDIIQRYTFLEARRTGKLSHGIEMGPLGTFTLRVVTPVVRKGEVVGYLELGKEVDHIADAIKDTLSLDVAVLIEKRFVDQKGWEYRGNILGMNQSAWDLVPNYVVMSLDKPELLDLIAPNISKMSKDEKSSLAVNAGDKNLILTSMGLHDVAKNNVGLMIIFNDETELVRALSNKTNLEAITYAVCGLLFFLFFYIRTKREESRITETYLSEIVQNNQIRLAEKQSFIAELTQSHDLIEQQSKFLQLMLDTVPMPVYYKDDKFRYLGCNKSFEQFFGMDCADIAGKTVAEVFRDNSRIHMDADDNLIKGQERYTYETQMRDANGKFRDVIVSKARFENKINNTVGIIGLIFDITESNALKKELQKKEERLASIFENLSIGINTVNLDGKFINANKTFCNMLGYTEDELLKLDVFKITHPNDLEMTRVQWKRVKQDNTRTMDYDTRYLKKDGTPVSVHLGANWVIDASGVPLYCLAIVEDTSKRRLAEETRDIFYKAIESSDESIIITDFSGKIIYVNPAMEHVTGYAREELLGRKPSLLKSGKHDRKLYDHLWETITSGGVWRGRFTNRKKNGQLFEEIATISSVRAVDGGISHFVAVKRDVTREIAMENDLRQAQKMEAIGTLATGISHDFNNILHAITGCAQVVLSHPVLSPKDREYLEMILRSASRGGDLVSQILTFGRTTPAEQRPFDLNREINEAIRMLSAALPKNVSFDLRLSADLLPVMGSPQQIQQILMNLAGNASDAMPKGGVITIATRNLANAEKPCVELSVSDCGTGMDSSTMERMYDPFYTTKGVGKGTGLGLATVYSIVKSHGGTIQCESFEGEGTTFRIAFPATSERRNQEARTVETEALKGGTELLLLVDDDPSILIPTGELLGTFGYSVLTAQSGEKALEVIVEKYRDIAVVLLDLGMPGMGGRGCLEELKTLAPDIKVIVASGYDAEEELTVKYPIVKAFLRKPFRMADLLGRIRTVIGK